MSGFRFLRYWKWKLAALSDLNAEQRKRHGGILPLFSFPGNITVIGCYFVDPDPWRLIELRVDGADIPFRVDDFRLPIPYEPISDWQAPYDEHLLDLDGTKELANTLIISKRPEILTGNLRLCFFMFVISKGSLLTPFGPVKLPPHTRKPERLSFIKFEEH